MLVCEENPQVSTANNRERNLGSISIDKGLEAVLICRAKMGSDAQRSGAIEGGGGGRGGFRLKIEQALYSGDKKHVLAGIAVIGIVFGIPWVLMNRGSKHHSHQDYLEKADKARSQRLSSSSSSAD